MKLSKGYLQRICQNKGFEHQDNLPGLTGVFLPVSVFGIFFQD